ncbi:phage tail family protein [Streptococcus oralis]|uniref:distal tail protein Dit n=1 Tax=Streptococcus oralis TaxID=1303 RepID=UPI00228398FF|nr:distal tail protein Dit [Streptococcus oralis]MCY7062957.1 phage tail family protein [Streptococcus oralis]
MSVVTMNFNKTDLSDLIEIHDVRRNIGNNRSIATSYTSTIGVNVQQQTIDAKFIEVEFSIWSKDRNTLKHKLAGIFNVSSAKKLVFSDEPDKYYLAMPIESISMQETSGRRSTGSIKFIVPDGVAHSSAYKSVTEPISATDRLVFEVNNEGNVDAYPIITIKNNSENGYVGIVNAQSAFEMGNREEIDAEIVKESEVLLDYRGSNILKGFQDAVKRVAVTNDNRERLVGTLSKTSLWGRHHIELSERGAFEKDRNNAQSLTWAIPTDSSGEVGSLNDYLLWRQVFMAATANQYGFIKVTVSDTDGNFLYGVETYKRYQTLDCEYSFFTTDGKGGYKYIKWWYFIGTGAQVSKLDPFSAEKGWTELKRNDDKVQVFFNGSYYDFVTPELKDKKSAKIHITLGAVRDKPLLPHMYIDEFMYRKDFVSVSKDLPNRYPIGSTIIVNNEEDTIMVDGINKFGDRVHGSSWIKLPPGKTQLEVYTSSWVKKKPTVSIEFEERWL